MVLNQSVTVVMVSEEEWDRSSHLEYRFVPYFTGYESYIVTQCSASLTLSIVPLVFASLLSAENGDEEGCRTS